MAKLFLQTGLLIGTIIGAGMFSLPFVFKNSGIATGIFYLILASVVYIFAYWMYADLVLRTIGDHRFAGYARIYLGRWAFWLSVLMTIAEMILVLTIYLILAQSFGNLIFAAGNPVVKMLIFWALGSLAVFASLKRIALAEFLISGGILAIIFMIFVFGMSGLSGAVAQNFRPLWPEILMPLAPVLFALSGRVAMPALIRFYENPRAIKASIILGVAVSAIAYLAFSLSILSLTYFVSEDAVSGLFGKIPDWALALVGLLGILSLISSYIVVGLDVKNSMRLDLKIPFWIAAVLIIGLPLVIYFFISQSFIELVSFTGGIFLGLEGIFIVWMWLKAKKVVIQEGLRLKFSLPTAIFLLSVFAAAVVYEIIRVVNYG